MTSTELTKALYRILILTILFLGPFNVELPIEDIVSEEPNLEIYQNFDEIYKLLFLSYLGDLLLSILRLNFPFHNFKYKK